MLVRSIAPPPWDPAPDGAVTVKLTDWAIVPPGPVQDKLRVSAALTTTAKVPLVI
jgi:hypothetical protein